jgi:hypothetical protein
MTIKKSYSSQAIINGLLDSWVNGLADVGSQRPEERCRHAGTASGSSYSRHSVRSVQKSSRHSSRLGIGEKNLFRISGTKAAWRLRERERTNPFALIRVKVPSGKKSLERFKKYMWPFGARIFGVLARLQRRSMFKNPVTELKRRQNPKRPLPFFSPEWLQYFLNRSKLRNEPNFIQNMLSSKY